jgi:7-cyano-7-deazaguanine synthase in queuosine biosynthesis
MMTDFRIQLFSGGLDSFAMWHLLGKPQPVYVRYGHKYEGRELETIRRLEQADPSLSVTTLDGPQIGGLEAPDGHIPHRNLLLIGTAVAALGPSVVYLGVLRGETSRDKSNRFLRQTSKLLSFCEGPVRVLSPSKRLTKTQLVAQFIRSFPGQVERLRVTRSCYAETELPCGQCVACFRRWVAMSNNGIHEVYEVEPWQAVRWDAGALGYLWRSPLAEWPGVLHNNLNAAVAIRRARRVSVP